MGHVVTILNLFTTREIGGNVVTVDTARQFPTLNDLGWNTKQRVVIQEGHKCGRGCYGHTWRFSRRYY